MEASTYTHDQTREYLEYIKYPLPPDSDDLPSPTLENLETLMKYQLCRLPFENLALHYAKDKKVVVDKDVSFERTVGWKRGRGGYCHELNNIFSTVMRTLGYDFYTTAGKVSLGAPYQAWDHFLIIATIEGKKYLVDTGFGDNNIIRPLPLVLNTIFPGIHPEEYRFIYKPIPGQVLPMHILQYRYSPSDKWIEFYAFCDSVQFSHEDYKMMSYITSTTRGTFFTETVFTLKAVMEDGEIVGRRIMNGKKEEGVKERRNGKSVKLIERFETEGKRVKALEEFFGIVLTEEEREGIKGDVAAL